VGEAAVVTAAAAVGQVVFEFGSNLFVPGVKHYRGRSLIFIMLLGASGGLLYTSEGNVGAEPYVIDSNGLILAGKAKNFSFAFNYSGQLIQDTSNTLNCIDMSELFYNCTSFCVALTPPGAFTPTYAIGWQFTGPSCKLNATINIQAAFSCASGSPSKVVITTGLYPICSYFTGCDQELPG